MERYKIGICELYNQHIHGFTEKVEGKYILAYELSLEEFMLDEYKLILELIKNESETCLFYFEQTLITKEKSFSCKL